MKTPAIPSWSEANQRALVAAVAAVRAALERHAARGKQPETHAPVSGVDPKLVAETPQPPFTSALDSLCAAFRLSPFERDLLVFCAGIELDSSFAACCAEAQGDVRRAQPTFSLALAALPEAHWSALAPAAPLRRWRLIELAGHDTLVSTPLRIDERVLHYLTGIDCLDERLQGVTEPLPLVAELPPVQAELAHHVAALWATATEDCPAPLVQLHGADGAERQAVAAAVGRELGMRLHRLRPADLPAAAGERNSLARLWEREAILGNRALFVEVDDTEDRESARILASFLGNVQGIVLIGRQEPLHLANRPIARFEVRRPSSAEQESLWRGALDEIFPGLNGEVTAVVSQFNLGAGGIRSVCTGLAARGDDARPPGVQLWEACRVEARPRLDDLAQRIELRATWDDLVLPEAQRQVLREMAAHVRQRTKVCETWGFATASTRGLGLSALFAGVSGTGKTMAAEVLAGELSLDLYRIDLSLVVSKYIGETEKNLKRVFDAAESGGAILLFDEADALFGKRSEVRDSHDRYANIEVSYLLQRMEAYRGLAILTTNMRESLDAAFLRRLQFVVQFPFPDAAQRAEIWRRAFPRATPVEGMDPVKLARLNVTGGHIRNMALNAAFLAADAGEPVRMRHLLSAARSEYAKLERPLTESEIGGWA